MRFVMPTETFSPHTAKELLCTDLTCPYPPRLFHKPLDDAPPAPPSLPPKDAELAE